MLFAAEGARVAITDINEEGGRAVAEEIGFPLFVTGRYDTRQHVVDFLLQRQHLVL